jgi:16S rRNA (cytidine1402-2'-O)-methyltransferase
MVPGKLYLLPTPLGSGGDQVLPEYALEIIRDLTVFVMEHGKIGRQSLKDFKIKTRMQECRFFELNKFTRPDEIPEFLEPAIKEGIDVGLMSDAGVPGVADPGAVVVMAAHRAGIEVIPLVGPSSILLSLMASGMNGQRFLFHGYLSAKRPQLAKDLKALEGDSRQRKETQLFIEAPYRNDAMLETAKAALDPSTLFCVACDLTLPKQFIKTQTIGQWKKAAIPDLHKRPTMFLLLAK